MAAAASPTPQLACDDLFHAEYHFKELVGEDSFHWQLGQARDQLFEDEDFAALPGAAQPAGHGAAASGTRQGRQCRSAAAGASGPGLEGGPACRTPPPMPGWHPASPPAIHGPGATSHGNGNRRSSGTCCPRRRPAGCRKEPAGTGEVEHRKVEVAGCPATVRAGTAAIESGPVAVGGTGRPAGQEWQEIGHVAPVGFAAGPEREYGGQREHGTPPVIRCPPIPIQIYLKIVHTIVSDEQAPTP